MSEEINSGSILAVKNVSKHFGGIQALNSVSLDVRYGEVHALVGENGAGKSTLMNILCGIIQRDSGEVIFKGRPVDFTDPNQAIQAGIAIIHQEPAMLPTLNVIDNMFMGRMKSHNGFIHWREMEARTREYLEVVGLTLNPRAIVKDLTTSQRQLIEVAKAVSMDASLIIMDEPNSSLSEAETERLFEVIRALQQRNVSIIYVSHKINEVLQISDRISVLRDGNFIGTVPKADASVEKIIEMMVGRKVDTRRQAGSAPRTEQPILQVKNLSGEGFEDVSFDLYPGEILGFAGLVGAGRSEMARTIFGDCKPRSGQIQIEGKPVEFNIPKEAIRYGIGMIQEDRKVLSLFMERPILFNISMARLPRMATNGFVRVGEERQTAESFVQSLNIRLSHLDAPVRSLSGGNQQKTVLARWLSTNPKVLIMDEPTHGVDVGAKAEIYGLMRNLAREGIAIILISSELPEIMTMSDRIAVMHEGCLTGILSNEEATESRIMSLATGSA
ncbi:MAG TPA: sugar ABC transporter ATP-binding protein [Anaerolineaceae bacterium]|nr:sugar ABC transporter ATP-binding protein [Anaerolineaceae bacterium]